MHSLKECSAESFFQKERSFLTVRVIVAPNNTLLAQRFRVTLNMPVPETFGVRHVVSGVRVVPHPKPNFFSVFFFVVQWRHDEIIEANINLGY